MTISSKIQWFQVFYPAIHSVFGDIIEVAGPSPRVISSGHYHGVCVWIHDRARTPSMCIIYYSYIIYSNVLDLLSMVLQVKTLLNSSIMLQYLRGAGRPVLLTAHQHHV